MKRQKFTLLIFIFIFIILQGCGKTEEMDMLPVEVEESRESEESISQNKTEEEIIQKGSSISWNGMQMEINTFGQEGFEVESIEKEEKLEIRVNCVSMNSTDVFNLECVDMKEDEVLKWGEKHDDSWCVYRVKFEKTDDYYIYIEKLNLDPPKEMYAVFFCEGKSYCISLQEQGSYWEYCEQMEYKERIPFLLAGAPEKISLFNYTTPGNRVSENYMFFAIGETAEFRGSFQDEKNGYTFTFVDTREWIEEKRHGMFDVKGEPLVDWGEKFILEITWNGEKKLTPIEGTVFNIHNPSQTKGFEVDDYNSDGYTDLRIIIEESREGYQLQDFYLWNPDIEDFVKVPTSEWKYTRDLRETEMYVENDCGIKYFFYELAEERYDQDNNELSKRRLWKWDGYELYVCAEMDSIWYEGEEKSVDHIYFLGRDGSVTYEEEVVLEGDERSSVDMLEILVEGVTR